MFRRNKYSATGCRCKKNHYHDSRGEARYCDELNLLEKAGELQEYKTQVNYDLYINDKKICRHIVDFEVINKEGKKEIHEFKGFSTALWQLKRKIFEAVYPDIEYKVIRYSKK